MDIKNPQEVPNQVPMNTGAVAQMPVEQIAKSYDSLYNNILNSVEKTAGQVANINDSVDTEKEIMRVRAEISNARMNYAKEWKNPLNVNYNSDTWEQQRNEAMKKLRETEQEILTQSKLEKGYIEKEESTNNKFYEQEDLNFTFEKGNAVKQTNITTAQNNLKNYTYLAFASENSVESDTMLNNINESVKMLQKNGIDTTVINENIMRNFNTRVKEEMIKTTQQTLRNANYSNWEMSKKMVEANKQNITQKSLAMIGKVDTLKDEEAKKVFEQIIQDNLQDIDTMVDQKEQNLYYRESVNQEKQRNAAQKKLDAYVKYFDTDRNLADRGDEQDLLSHRTNNPMNPEPNYVSYALNDKLFGDDYSYALGKYVYGTPDNPKVINLEDVGTGKSFETTNLLSGQELEEYKGNVESIKKNGGSYTEMKEYTYNFFKSNSNPTEYGVDPYSKEFNDKIEGATLTALKQVGLDPKKFQGDMVSKNRVDEYISNLNKNNYYNEGAYLDALKPYVKGEKKYSQFFKGDLGNSIVNVRNKLIKLNGGTSSEQVDRMAIKYVLSVTNMEKDLLKEDYDANPDAKAKNLLDAVNRVDVLNGNDNTTLDKDLNSIWEMYIRGVNYTKAPIKKIKVRGLENGE